MAVGSVAAFMNPEIIVLAGRVVGGGDLVLDVLRHRLKGNVYDPPRLVIGALGHRDIVLGAVRLVLDATTLYTADRPGDSRPRINRSRLTATESRH